jgi:tetratricopeptide (TPR) repeat protein
VRLLSLLALLLLAATAGAEVYSWVDEQGITHITDDRARIPESARSQDGQPEALGSLWESPVDPGAPPVVSRTPSRSEDRARRVLEGALADLARGENARAVAALHSLLREDPGRAEPHWYMAQVDRERGRYDAAEAHLRAFLAAAGDDLEPQRAEAQRRLGQLEDERRLADPLRDEGPARWASVDHSHFRVRYDAELGEASPDYALVVTGYLEEARRDVAKRLGVVTDEPMGVVLYGKAAYLRAHRHRFSFQTVGFFDGRIHVVSAAHPAGELRALLYHEYTHAIFREQTGGDRPFWLNEGLSELAERASHGQEGMTRSERVALKGRIDAGSWIPLRRLAPSFSGLDDEDARSAYLEALAAALWIQERTTPAVRRQLLEFLGQGLGDDEALRRVLSIDTAGLDTGVQSEILSEFPRIAR